MNAFRRWSLITAVALTAGLAMPGARLAAAATSPDFNSVQWTALGCPNADLITHDSPASAEPLPHFDLYVTTVAAQFCEIVAVSSETTSTSLT